MVSSDAGEEDKGTCTGQRIYGTSPARTGGSITKSAKTQTVFLNDVAVTRSERGLRYGSCRSSDSILARNLSPIVDRRKEEPKSFAGDPSKLEISASEQALKRFEEWIVYGPVGGRKRKPDAVESLPTVKKAFARACKHAGIQSLTGTICAISVGSG